MGKIQDHTISASATPNSVDITGVEIFRVGTWNGNTYSSGDLDDMVSAFGEIGWKPPLKLGHSEDDSAPAYGWVEGLRRVGDWLVADLSAVPSSMAEQIKERRYDAVSSEVYHDLNLNGRKFRRVLRAVALLGAAPPGVDGLKPLSQSLSLAKDAECGALNTYSITSKERATMAEDPKKVDDKVEETKVKKAKGEGVDATDLKQFQALQAENARLAATVTNLSADIVKLAALSDQVTELRKQAEAANEARRIEKVSGKVSEIVVPAYRPFFAAMYDLATRHETTLVKFTSHDGKDAKTTEISPVAALDGLAEVINRHAKRMFTEMTGRSTMPRDDAAVMEKAADEVDRLARKKVSDGSAKNYKEGMDAVLAENPDLKMRYAARQ